MIKLHEIHKIYTQGKTGFHALKDVSLYFEKNEAVFVYGKSGCGKTTLLNLIAGLDQPSSGEMAINGKLTSQFKESEWDYFRNHNIGFIFQQFNLIEQLPVLENVAINAKISGNSHTKSKKMALEMLKKVGLEKHAKKTPRELSGGERQRVGIARALINDPDIILADEPTGALDKKTGTEIMDLIKSISKGKLLIVVTHDLSMAKRYATRMIELRDGKVVSDSEPKDQKVKLTFKREKHRKSLSFKEGIRLAFFNMKARAWRSTLVAMGLAIGIIGLILINSLFITIRTSLTEQGELLRDNPELTILYRDDSFSSREEFVETLKTDYPYWSDISYSPNFSLSIVENETTQNPLINPLNLSRLTATPQSAQIRSLYDDFIGDGRFPENESEFALTLSQAQNLFSPDARLTRNEIWERVQGNEYKIATNFQYRPDESMMDANECQFVEDWDGEEASLPEGFFEDFENSSDLESHMETLSIYRDEPIEFQNRTYFCDDYTQVLWHNDYNNPTNFETLTLVGIIDEGVFGNALFHEDFLMSIDTQEHYYEMQFKAIGYLDSEHIDEKASIIRSIEDDGFLVRETTTPQFNLLSGLSVLFTYIIQFVFSAIAAIAVITAGLMLLMILYISVLERTREIGLIRSLGGTRKDVRNIFVGETTMIGLFAALISIAVSLIIILFSNVVFPEQLFNFLSQYYRNLPEGPLFTVNIRLMAYAIVGSVVIAVISGLIPSIIAGKKQPIEALRND